MSHAARAHEVAPSLSHKSVAVLYWDVFGSWRVQHRHKLGRRFDPGVGHKNPNGDLRENWQENIGRVARREGARLTWWRPDFGNYISPNGSTFFASEVAARHRYLETSGLVVDTCSARSRTSG